MIAKPLRRRDQNHPSDPGKGLHFMVKVLLGTIYKPALRIPLFIGAVETFFPPFAAIDKRKIAAMAGKGPTIVQGPDNGNIFTLQEVKEDLHVQVISVQIMQMNGIGIYRFNAVDQLFSRPYG